jgi:hypothetical protein
MIVYEGVAGNRTGRVSLTAPPPPPPPPMRPVADIEAELGLQRQLVEALESDVIPRGVQARDRLAEALSQVQARLDALSARIADAQQAERERQVADGQLPQWGWIMPQGAAAHFGLTDIDRLIFEHQALVEKEWMPANRLHLAQEHHLVGLRRRLFLEQQRLGALEGELREAQASAAAPRADPEAPGGRLHDLRQQLAQMGVGPLVGAKK